MRNIKARTLWILSLIELLIGVGLIFACIYSSDTVNKIMIILMTLDFFILALTIQFASFKSFKFKPKKETYDTKEYVNDNNLFDKLNELKYDIRERSYGKSYLKIDKRRAFKVVLITDPNGYFNHEEKDEDNDNSLNKKLDNCLTFTAIEIFLSSNDELREKLPDFTIQVDKVYYTALEKIDDNHYLCHNYEKPRDKHIEDVSQLLDELGFKEVNEE